MNTTPVRNTLNGRVHLHGGDSLPTTGPIPVLCGVDLPSTLAERVEGPHPPGARCAQCAGATS